MQPPVQAETDLLELNWIHGWAVKEDQKESGQDG